MYVRDKYIAGENLDIIGRNCHRHAKRVCEELIRQGVLLDDDNISRGHIYFENDGYDLRSKSSKVTCLKDSDSDSEYTPSESGDESESDESDYESDDLEAEDDSEYESELEDESEYESELEDESESEQENADFANSKTKSFQTRDSYIDKSYCHSSECDESEESNSDSDYKESEYDSEESEYEDESDDSYEEINKVVSDTTENEFDQFNIQQQIDNIYSILAVIQNTLLKMVK